MLIKKVKEILKSKKGNSMVMGIAIVIFILMLLILLMHVYSIMYNFNVIQSVVRDTLDVHMVKYEVAYGDSVKSGSGSFTDIQKGVGIKKNFDKTAFITDIQKKLVLDSHNERYHNGNALKYKISNIKISLIQEQELKAEVTYHVSIPIYFLGKPVVMFGSDATVTSRHNQKFENKSIK